MGGAQYKVGTRDLVLLRNGAGYRLTHFTRNAKMIGGNDDDAIAAIILQGKHSRIEIMHFAFRWPRARRIARHPDRLLGRYHNL